ncbi:radical SAM protein with 4Fe4S-binding SPASM domain [Clostridium beijerinckii]|uniref:Radical SAM protein with 4Fe4S-binding SPASM domain n=2 Tax=Clostridium beijerinckii TaxID=1520 RepID=A0AAX0AVS3_CLOBE|nr:radical SAM protein with 4Fe4S-binding SPASM domain [Clostridium beijerinckii]
MFRNYGSFGYITDNRNFGYKQANDDGNDIGDKIVSQSGAVFLSVLNKIPQTLDCLAEKISMQFTNADIETIKIDAREFYYLLELEGFIVSGETLQECNEKDSKFSYKKVQPKNEKEGCSLTKGFEKSTQEFFDEYFKNEPQLTNLHIEITSKCNERCVHCYIPHENKVNNIEPDLFYNILEQCKKMNLLHLTLSGGEPMMHNDFIDFLRKCNEYNFSVNILSNLTLLNKSIIEEMKRNRLLSVQVSLYSMDANIHDEITQIKGSFEKTKNAILKLRENDIPLQISCPIIKQNINCYNDVIDWGKAYNINVGSDYVIIARYDHTTQNLSNRLSVNDVKEIINQRSVNEPQYLELIEREAEHKKNMTPDDFICSVCHSSICIADNGNVYPCAGWQDYVVGNVNETSLNDIWKKSTKVRYLRELRRRDFPKCIKCPENEFCTMCMVRNANEHPLGDPLVVNEYFCNMAKLNKKMVLDWKCNLINSQGKY